MKKLHSIILAAAATTALLLPVSAQAAYTVYLYESGGNVIASGSGRLDLSGTTPPVPSATVALVAPSAGLLYTGIAGPVQRYGGIAGPTDFGPGIATPANSQMGQLVGIVGNQSEFFVPSGYVSGGALSSRAVWNGTNLLALGATPGTYVWTWAGDTYTVIVGAAPAVPVLSPWGLATLSLALVGFASRRLRRMRTAT